MTILHACMIDRKTGKATAEGEQAFKNITPDSLLWVHLDGKEESSREWLMEELGYLDPVIVDALLAEETRPRIVEFDEGALIILRGVNLNDNAEPEDMISIRMWVDQNQIISVRFRQLKAVKDMRERMEAGRGPKSSGEFVNMLAARLFERMEPVFAGLDEELDNVEELVMESPEPSERQRITAIRKQAIIFRRYIAPQRDVIAHLRTSEQEWLTAVDKRRLQESLDRVVRYVEDLDAIRERAQIIKDELATALSDKMNKNLYMLSVIAAIFLPLGFLTGLLGINVGGIPGADNPEAFMMFCGGLGIIILLQVIIFKILKWF